MREAYIFRELGLLMRFILTRLSYGLYAGWGIGYNETISSSEGIT